MRLDHIVRQRIAQAREHKVRVEDGTVRPHPAEKERRKMKLPNLAGIGSSLDKLKVNLEARAAKFIAKVEATDQRGAAVFDRAEAHLAGAEAELKGVQDYLDEVESAIGGNGAPPLDDESSKP
jgi:hypothetical protein